MSKSKRRKPGHLFPSAAEDIKRSQESHRRNINKEYEDAGAYRLAFDDQDFLLSDELRGERLMLELKKPEFVLQKNKVHHTVAIFGSARLPSADAIEQLSVELESDIAANPDDPTHPARAKTLERQKMQTRYYEEARKLSSLITDRSKCEDCPRLHVVTGGGPGIMEAANLGAMEAKGESIAMNIVLPHEQYPNAYVSPKFCFQFHYFAIRKMHFLLRARAIVVFPGGFGTLDELFETLTLVQTKKIEPLPILIFGREFWEKLINFDFMVEQGVISAEDLELFSYVETAQEAWDIIKTSLLE